MPRERFYLLVVPNKENPVNGTIERFKISSESSGFTLIHFEFLNASLPFANV